MRTAVSAAGSDKAPSARAARVTRTSRCRWTARLRTGLAFLDQESRWWRRRQLGSLLQNAAEVRWHRSFDDRACRTTLRETGCVAAADVYQPYLRRAPYEGLVFILSLLSTVNATHVSSLFLDVPAAVKSIAEPPMTHVTHGTSGHGSALGLSKVFRQGEVLVVQTAVPFGHCVPGIRHRTTGTVVVPDGISANTSFTDRSTRVERPTVPARTCTPIATRSGRSRWPNGPWAARSAARTRSSAGTSSRTLLLLISGLRVVPGTPRQPRTSREGRGGYHLT